MFLCFCFLNYAFLTLKFFSRLSQFVHFLILSWVFSSSSFYCFFLNLICIYLFHSQFSFHISSFLSFSNFLLFALFSIFLSIFITKIWQPHFFFVPLLLKVYIKKELFLFCASIHRTIHISIFSYFFCHCSFWFLPSLQQINVLK